ncbi:hypothetical protein [Pseudomonas paralcaligenes]|uniref:hypothetical protein n=1 Tax=Pseudomonas paralcaligenes TaxID=2772558 RepID=UPI001C7ED37F|nr:hypothetical protein [Pseudomonas paralcaligenes]
MKIETATLINDLMLTFLKELSKTCAIVRDECSPEETSNYFKPAAHISALTFDILDQIHAQYPELKPPEFTD